MKICAFCGESFPKPKTISWPHFEKRRYCTRTCMAKGMVQQRVQVSEKRCSHCKTVKTVDQFSPNLSTVDGLRHACRSCEVAITRRSQQRYPERVLSRRKAWEVKNRETIIAKGRERYLADPRYHYLKRKAWAERNPERLRYHVKKWRAKNPDKVRAMSAVRRARLKNAPGHATVEQVLARVAYYGGLCWMCRKKPWTSIDHVIPLGRGGTNWPANLRPACGSCNSKKWMHIIHKKGVQLGFALDT